ncbi:MAG TPA: kelch repeat-containing protein [Bryobacteraceae bacterium]|nr:kelch repeat-containing protein [Bryobacteraceae bacterium]
MKVIVGAIFLCWAAGAQSNWALQSPANHPVALLAPQMTYDPLHLKVVLFSGTTSNGSSATTPNDTWLWDGQQANWSHVNPAHKPAGRLTAGMVFDAARQQIVLFGGGTELTFGDTWVWDGTDWTQKFPANSPPARQGVAMAYDAARQQVVLFGGLSASGTILGDTWTWDGNNWTQQHPATSPSARVNHQMAYDEARQETVLFGGEDFANDDMISTTWVWNGGNWIARTPVAFPPGPNPQDPTFRLHSMVFDSALQQTVLFGGYNSGPQSATWFWDGTNWTQFAGTGPGARYGTGMAYDSTNRQVVLFGGDFHTASGFFTFETWTFSGPSQTSVNIVVPAGAQFTFNGLTYTGSQTIQVAAGTYGLSTTSPQAVASGTQLVFRNWSDGGAISHSVTVPSGGSVNLTGTFGTQYVLSTVANPNSGGTVSGGGFYDAGTTASPTASPNGGFSFANWSGACSGSGPCSVVMSAPATVTANFNASLIQFTVNVPAAAQFTFNGTTYAGTQTISAPPGAYTLSTTTPQATVAGTQLTFVSWSDGGGISHTVTLSGVSGSITGTFKTQYLLTTSALPANAGTVAPLIGGTYFDSGTLVNVGSVANVGFQFQYWTGACAGSAAICQVLMNAPQTVVGNFTVTPKWIQLGPANSPKARNLAPMAFDAGRNEIVIFGGTTGASFLGDTWTWNGTNWTLRATAGPSPRDAGAMAYDPVHGQIVMFGGFNGNAFLNETWTWDGGTGIWTQQRPLTSPSGRAFPSLAWDGSRLILFGGNIPSGYDNQTWSWDGSNWLQLSPATVPPPRAEAGMTYDAARNQIVMFGGSNSVFLADTWIWSGSNWIAKSPAVSPAKRSSGMFAYDPVIQQSVLFSGRSPLFPLPDEVWLWDGAAWKSVPENPSPAARADALLAYDAARQQVVLFGGFDTTDAALSDTWIFANNAAQQFYTLTTAANPVGAGTVAAASPGQAGPSYRAGSTVTLTASSTPSAPFGFWSGACAGMGSGSCTLTMLSNVTAIANYPTPPRWIQLGPAKMPQSRYGAGMAFDSSRGETVLFSGGYQDHAEVYANETWIWNGSNWSQRFPAAEPSSRDVPAMAYDVNHHQVVLFGGANSLNVYGDTWIWDGAAGNWTQANPVHSPAARAGANLAWDGTRLILFGGRLMDGTLSSETWAWSGTDWSLLSAAGGPGARQDGMMTFDPVRQQVVLFGGRATDFVTLFNDTWTWDGSTWTKRSPAVTPPARSGGAMAWHGVIQQVVLFSGVSAAGFVPDTWLWDGTNWTLHAEAVSPSGQSGSAAAWDSVAQQMILLSHYAGDYGEMWIYANNAVQQFHTLTSSASPAAGGTVSPAGTQTLRAGSLVFLTATAAAGLEFQGWSGACAGSYRGCVLFLNGDFTVTANFGFPLSWLQLNPATSAAPKGNLMEQNPISMAFDVARQQVVYFGGPAGDQTWTWNGTTWTKRSPAHSPPARSGHAMAYDAARQRVILFGGGNGVPVNDTWAWDGTDWTLVDAGTGPGARFNHAMAYDRARQEIVLFGGLDMNHYYTDTWAWNGAQWILRQASGGPPARSDFGMAFDPVNAEVVISSGYEGISDTWGWNGSGWTRKFPPHLPPAAPNRFSQMTYDEHLQRTVMLVDNYPSAPQTWVWDGQDWTQLAPTQNPTPRAASGIVYDGVRGQVLLFGGDNFPSFLNDTWVLAPPTAILSIQSVSASKNAAGNYLVTFALKNTGNTAANGVFGFSATAVTLVGGASTTTNTFPLGQFSNIAPGASGTFQAQFPATAGSGGHSFAAQGGYATVGGAAGGGNWSIAVRSVTFP